MLPIDWNAAVNVMRDALPSAQFKNWVEPLSLIHCANDRIVLGVPSKFHEEWVRNNYSAQITNALEFTCGRQLSLEFEVFEENARASQAELKPVVQLNRPLLKVARAPDEPVDQPQPAQAPNAPPLNHPFFELESNRIAFQSASHFIFSDNPTVNPLVLEAGVGMGKTHLLSHIAKTLHQRKPSLRIHYTNTEAFRSELYQSYQNNTHAAFRSKYWEEIDCLLFDDFHTMGPKQRTQEELLHIFNEITARGGRLVFATSLPITKIDSLMDPLRSRLLSGISADIRFPTVDDRLALLAQVALHREIAVDDVMLRALADKGLKDNRKLISTLLGLHLQAQIANRVLDAQYLSDVGVTIETRKEMITIEEIVLLVEHGFGVSRENLTSKSRKSGVNWARQVAMYLARCYTHLSMDAIGTFFGRDHATVVHAYQKVADALVEQPTRRYEVQHLKQKLQSRAPKNHVPF